MAWALWMQGLLPIMIQQTEITMRWQIPLGVTAKEEEWKLYSNFKCTHYQLKPCAQLVSRAFIPWSQQMNAWCVDITQQMFATHQQGTHWLWTLNPKPFIGGYWWPE